MKPIASLLAVAAIVSCSDAFKPTTENVLGDYTARMFTTADAGLTIDWLQLGGSMAITLGPSGIATGHIFMPGSARGGTDVYQTLNGHWTLSGSTMTFTTPVDDNFVVEMPWTVWKDELLGDHTLTGNRVRVVLTK